MPALPRPAAPDEIRSMLLRWMDELLAAHASGHDVQFYRQASRPGFILLFVTITEDELKVREAGA